MLFVSKIYKSGQNKEYVVTVVNQRICKFNCQLGHLTFVESDYEIVSTVISSLPLIQDEYLSVTGENICI